MATGTGGRRRTRRSLTARVLQHTLAFAALWAAASYVTSVSAFWLSEIEDQLRGAYDTVRVVQVVSEGELDPDLRQRLLAFTETQAVILRTGDTSTLVIGSTPTAVDKTVRPAAISWPGRVRHAFDTLINGRGRILRIVGPAEQYPSVVIEVVAPEAPLAEAMWQHSLRIGASAIAPFIAVGVLLFFVLQHQFVRPVTAIIERLAWFARNPDDVDTTVKTSDRRDEIGDLERGVLSMQGSLRALLHRRDREAALGASVSRINHDLRNVLQTAAVASDQIKAAQDPGVRKLVPLLVKAVERAVQICTRTLDYHRFGGTPITLAPTRLREIAVEVGDSVAAIHEGRVDFQIDVPGDLVVEADQAELFRALLNLAQNATDAMPDGGKVSVRARRRPNHVLIEVEDNGPGLQEEVRAFFERPFADTVVNAHGLGLVIVREIMAAHGGTFELGSTSSSGTRFLLKLSV